MVIQDQAAADTNCCQTCGHTGRQTAHIFLEVHEDAVHPGEASQRGPSEENCGDSNLLKSVWPPAMQQCRMIQSARPQAAQASLWVLMCKHNAPKGGALASFCFPLM